MDAETGHAGGRGTRTVGRRAQRATRRGCRTGRAAGRARGDHHTTTVTVRDAERNSDAGRNTGGPKYARESVPERKVSH